MTRAEKREAARIKRVKIKLWICEQMQKYGHLHPEDHGQGGIEDWLVRKIMDKIENEPQDKVLIEEALQEFSRDFAKESATP